MSLYCYLVILEGYKRQLKASNRMGQFVSQSHQMDASLRELRAQVDVLIQAQDILVKEKQALQVGIYKLYYTSRYAYRLNKLVFTGLKKNLTIGITLQFYLYQNFHWRIPEILCKFYDNPEMSSIKSMYHVWETNGKFSLYRLAFGFGLIGDIMA